MTKKSFPQPFLVVSLVGLGLLILGMKSITPPLSQAPPSPTITSESPSPEASTLSTPLTCLSAEELQSLAGTTYTLSREEYIHELKQVECSYQASNQVRGATPSLEYTLQRTTSDKHWQEVSQQLTTKPSYRRIEENKDILADLNPGAEINQATFYGKNDQLFLTLTYTPVKEQPGDILAKGVKLSELILQKTPR